MGGASARAEAVLIPTSNERTGNRHFSQRFKTFRNLRCSAGSPCCLGRIRHRGRNAYTGVWWTYRRAMICASRLAAGVCLLLLSTATSACAGMSTGGDPQSLDASWQCPPSPAGTRWPTPTHSSAEVLVPDSPTIAFRCTYESPAENPGTGTLTGGSRSTYTGTRLAELIRSLNSAGPAGAMSCPATRPGQVLHNHKFNFVYPDGGSAVIDWIGANCPSVTNGTATSAAPNEASTSSSSVDRESR
ncbi:hypothetical protein C7458_10512 [Williamsia muralis]|nr:hypothetical protein C7458_10512 [Williamsia marianensis]